MNSSVKNEIKHITLESNTMSGTQEEGKGWVEGAGNKLTIGQVLYGDAKLTVGGTF